MCSQSSLSSHSQLCTFHHQQDIDTQAFQAEIVSMSLDWISKRLYLFTVSSATATLEIVEVPVQAPSQRSVVTTMNFNGTLRSTISPNTRYISVLTVSTFLCLHEYFCMCWEQAVIV